jgi:hypothetical protein
LSQKEVKPEISSEIIRGVEPFSKVLRGVKTTINPISGLDQTLCVEYYFDGDYYIVATMPGVLDTPDSFDQAVEYTKAEELNILFLEPEILEELLNSFGYLPHCVEGSQ